MLLGLLLATLGVLEPVSIRPSGPPPGHQREVIVVVGLLIAASAGAILLVLLGRRDPLVPDEKYYGLIASRPSGSRSRKPRR